MLRDMNKARIAFDGAEEVATGHWGCGAYGNNHNLMFLKQWLAASEAGAKKIFVYDFGTSHSHHIYPLIRRLTHFTVGQLWAFLLELTEDLRPCVMGGFYTKVANIAVGKLKMPAPNEPHETLEVHEVNAAPPTPPSASIEQAELTQLLTFTLDVLKAGIPEGVDAGAKEDFLSNLEFAAQFNMSRKEFSMQPGWKKQAMKKKVGLF